MTIFQLLLALHIICGGISLLLGLFVLLTKKGDKRHQVAGITFFYAMLSTSLLALIMSILHPSYFLFIIGIFTTYMLLTGKRYLKKKNVKDVKAIDWILTFTMLLFGIAFMVYGAYNLMNGRNFGIVLLVFGAISLLFVSQDYFNFKGKASVKNYWLLTHIQRMIGSYIASVTAFLVVNNTILPGIIAWLLPTFLLVPFIIYWSRKYEIKLKGKA
jgi:uncharacterized membrane protein